MKYMKNDMVDLAVALRSADFYGMNEGICNHFSVCGQNKGVSGIWINPNNKLWSRVTANDLVFLSEEQIVEFQRMNQGPNNVEATAFYIHSAVSEMQPSTKAILHTHSPYSTALACFEEIPSLSIHQNFARFHNRLSIVDEYTGLILDVESARDLASNIQSENGIVLLKNHGVISIGQSVATAFDDLYYFERAAQVLIHCLTSGLPLKKIEKSIFEIAASQFSRERELQAQFFFAELRSYFMSDVSKEI